MDLLHFRAHIAQVFTKVYKTRKRGRPQSYDQAETPPPIKLANVVKRLQTEVRLHNVGHLPKIGEQQNFSWCKKPNCKEKNKISLLQMQCLCLDKAKNCFYDYHTSLFKRVRKRQSIFNYENVQTFIHNVLIWAGIISPKRSRGGTLKWIVKSFKK